MRNFTQRQIDRFFALPDPTAISPEVVQHFRRNFLVNVGDITMWLFGASFVSVSTILPVYAAKLTDSPLVIGMIPALTDAGWFLPQLFMAPYVERLTRKLPTITWLGALERLPYLVLALAVIWLNTLPPPIAVVIFLVIIAWKSLASGLVAMPWQELIATVIPVSHRGRFFGISHLAGHLLGVGGASMAAIILARLPYPRNFAVIFFIGFLSITLSFVFVLLNVEPRKKPAANLQNSQHYLQRLSSILRGNSNFRTYLLSQGLTYFGGMAYGFMAVYGVQRFGLPDAQAAIFTAILFASSVAGYALWGPIGDRVGHKRVLELTGAFWLAALLMALIAPSAEVFYVVFALIGINRAGGILGDFSIAMEFGPEAERPTYIGLARTVTGPVLFLAPLLGGAILQLTSYTVMLGFSLVFAVAGLGILRFRVVEPRDLPTTTLPNGSQKQFTPNESVPKTDLSSLPEGSKK